MNKIFDFAKQKIKDWLELDKGMNPLTARIVEPMSFEANVFKNQLWYRGDPSELHQFYTSIDDMMGNTKFWQAEATNGIDFRKIHTGLPSMIVDILSDIVFDDMNEFEFDNDNAKQIWEDIEKSMPSDFFKDAFKQAMYLGDGAVRFCLHPNESHYPIAQFYGADQVDFEYNHGKIVKIIFKLPYMISDREYILKEIHTETGITYELINDRYEKENLYDFEEFQSVRTLYHSCHYWTAVPIIIGKSPKYKGRGKSLFDGKEDAFDSFDEAYSQWIEALRDNRTKQYIPLQMIPKDGATGNLLKPNVFDGRFVEIKGIIGTEGTAPPRIEVVNGQIDTNGLLAAYTTALGQCLQGLISPSTLGIDVKKLDNAEAQREKEKATLYTRNKIIKVAEKAIPKIIIAALNIMDTMQGEPFKEYDVTCDFGEYANPSFEAVIETMAKARPGVSIMSIEASLDELYGDTKDEEWKQEEAKRLKEEQGILSKEMPAINEFDDLGGVVPTEDDYIQGVMNE